MKAGGSKRSLQTFWMAPVHRMAEHVTHFSLKQQTALIHNSSFDLDLALEGCNYTDFLLL